MIFVETSHFTKMVGYYLDDDEYADLQYALGKNPKQGTVIPGTGGLRKTRAGVPDTGKSKKDDLTQNEKKALTRLTTKLKAEARAKLRGHQR